MSTVREDCTRSGAYDTPQSVENRPGLDKLRYRVGTFTSFRNSMLRRITRLSVKIDDSLPDGTVGNEIAPLRTWSARDSADYGIALIELWAYVADILTFYQERIANEAFLRTATLRDSLLRLAALLDYKANPGVAATSYLAFTMKADTTATLRKNFPVQHVPVCDEKPQKFETNGTLLAQAMWNQLTPLPDAAKRLQFAREQKSTALAGVRLKIAIGDWALMVGPPRAPVDPLTTDRKSYNASSEQWDLRQVTSVTPQAAVNETDITWEEGLGFRPYRRVVVAPDGDLFILRGRAALFGYDAINWNALDEKLQDKLQPPPSSPLGALPSRYTDWLNTESNNEQRLDLNREYPEIGPGSWIVLMNSAYRELYRVLRVETVNRSDYLMSRQVTRLYLDTDEHFDKFGLANGDAFSKIRQTVVLHTSERLPLASRVTPTPVTGALLTVVEDVSALESGRQLMVYGPTATKGTQGEVVSVKEIHDQHTLVLEPTLTHTYLRAQTIIYGNVVEATHGETIDEEILGNGEAAIPFQSFVLKQGPLTFVAQAGADGGAVASLEVRVNGVKWHEVPTFYGHSGSEAIFTSTITDEQATVVRLGDGATGALPSSGRNNVTATYRKGIGQPGNLPATVIKTLLERPKGLQQGFNPLPSSGGVEPEPAAQIRQNAPNTVRTFGRIVSLRDFEDAAREFTGVAKARAILQWDGEWQTVQLIVAGEGGSEIVDPRFSILIQDLNSRRDRNRKLSVVNFCPVDLQLSALIYPNNDYLPAVVMTNVQAALAHYFHFDQLMLGQSIPLSELYQTIHRADGVLGAEITRFRAKPPAPCAAAPTVRLAGRSDLLQQVVQIAPYELAQLDTTAPTDFVLTEATNA